jgi:hypothetical protein
MKLKSFVAAIALAANAFAQEEPPAPAEEDLAGRIESLVEAFTETRNTVEALNRLRIAGYVQAEYVSNEASANRVTGVNATQHQDTFRVRRGRLNFQYQLAPTSRIVIQPDLSSSGVALRDAYLELSEPWTAWRNTLTAGQFKWPFGFEVRQSSRDREMPERTLVIRTLFPGERDRGVQLSGNGFAERFNYRVGVFNGNGTTTDRDLNKRKDVVARVGASLGALDFGLSGYNGRELVPLGTTGNPIPQGEFEKDRYGVDVQWITPVPGLGVRGEFIRGTQPPANNAGATARTADVEGWYVYAIQNLGTRHQFVLRVDEYDPNVDRDDVDAALSTRTIGGSYIFHWDANIKAMLAYESPARQRRDVDDDQLTVRLQFSF